MSTWASDWVPFSPKQYDIPLKKRARGYNCTALAALAGWMRRAGAPGIKMDGQLKNLKNIILKYGILKDGKMHSQMIISGLSIHRVIL